MTPRVLMLDAGVADAIAGHGRETYPHECCGALLGADGLVQSTVPLPNTTEEGPRRRFLVRPGDYQQAEQAASAGGRELLAQACAALDRAEALREHIDRDGEVTRTKAGLKAHPALKDEIAARSFVVRTLHRLGPFSACSVHATALRTSRSEAPSCLQAVGRCADTFIRRVLPSAIANGPRNERSRVHRGGLLRISS